MQFIFSSEFARIFVNATMRIYTQRLIHRLDQNNLRISQTNILKKLIRQAQSTKFGKDHKFSKIKTITEYQNAVPLRTYENFWQEYWEKNFPVLKDVTWPGLIKYFALSSGTVTAKTKYIPVSAEMLKSNRLAAMTMQGRFFEMYPDNGLYKGRFLFLGGSTNLEKLADGIFAGDLSGIAVDTSPSVLLSFAFPDKKTALIDDWDEKLKKIVEQTMNMKITGISGVPSWVLILLEELKKHTGSNSLQKIWPDLKLVVHGGVKFDPYRKTFTDELADIDYTFLETYPASEGFIAFEDLRYRKLRLMSGHDIFFEFVPVHELDSENPTRHTVHNIEKDLQYAVVVTTCAGLWSYILGDTITFENTDPPLLRFTGRTKYFMSAFGEHLISEEIESAVSGAAHNLNSAVADFHVGPVFPQKSNEIGRHCYIVEFERGEKTDPDKFSEKIDDMLSEKNADYLAHRKNDISMLKPEIVTVKKGAFREWMKSKGKLGGQHKVPRMDNSGDITREILAWMKSQNKILY